MTIILLTAFFGIVCVLAVIKSRLDNTRFHTRFHTAIRKADEKLSGMKTY